MIFRIKHSWRLTLVVTGLWAAVNIRLGAWDGLGETAGFTVLAWGVGGALAALLINGALHELLKRVAGDSYRRAFESYGAEILDGMRWPAYITGGLMAAVAEEPFFRGLVLPAVEHPIAGVAVSALLFAACHWLRARYFGFWFWALWEGVLFGILMVATDCLLVPVIAHGIHDAVAYRVFDGMIRRDG